MKVLLGIALRQTTGFVESLLRLVGPDGSVPDFSTLSRRQKAQAVNIPFRGSKGPLHLLIPSTASRSDAARGWRKIHSGIDEETLEVRAVHCLAGDCGTMFRVSVMTKRGFPTILFHLGGARSL